MLALKDFKKISDYEWEVPTSFRKDMRVPVRLFATRRLLEESLGDELINQAVNTATLPGLVGQVVVMPDMHQGYGFPIGAVAATRFPDGVISPGGSAMISIAACGCWHPQSLMPTPNLTWMPWQPPWTSTVRAAWALQAAFA